MRAVLTIVVLSAGSLPAQGALTTHYNSTGVVPATGVGVYFDLTANTALTLDRIDLNLSSPAGTPGRIEVHVRPATWIGHVEENVDWVRVAEGSVIAAGVDQPSPCLLTRPVGLPAGDFGVALRLVDVEPAFVTTPRSYATPDLELRGGGAATEFLASPSCSAYVFSGALHYSLAGGPFSLGEVTSFGHGCGHAARSFYESFAPQAFDLGNSRLVLTPNGLGGYDVTRRPARKPTLPANATNLGLMRGGAVFVPLPTPLSFPGGVTSRLLVFADGHVALTDRGLLSAPSNPPTVTALLAHQPKVAIAWQDLAPLATANVYSAVDAATGTVTIIWWRVPVHGTTGSGNTFAFTVHPGGELELRYGRVANPTGGCLVGFGAGPGAQDPGPRDLSASSSFATRQDDPGLVLSTRGRPVLGTRMAFAITGMHPRTTLCAVGFARPGSAPAIDLEPFGAPGCLLLLDPATTGWQALDASRETHLTTPRLPALLGVILRAQAAAFEPPANALGLITSQGAELVVGSL